jgi:nitrite reductase/ring-hydroxylating ferredoxin subunit
MGFIKRILGICETKAPKDASCWSYNGNQIEIDLSRAPELDSEGGALRLEGRGLPERVLLVHGRDGEFHAYRNRCTHMGRRLDPQPGDKPVQCCSVSKSGFEYSGSVISGPGKGPLTLFPVQSRKGSLLISIG